MNKPSQSYTIWFSQRTGSTLLSEALGSTGVAGKPGEWLHFQHKSPETLKHADLEQIWEMGTTPNGVFGIKINFEQRWIDAIRKLYQLPSETPRAEVWSTGFPNCTKHIYMTRRNKVRLAVSWWRAIVSGEWHRQHGAQAEEKDIADQYHFDAIKHLLVESSMCEAAIEDFLSESGIVPLTIVYEDFVQYYEGTVRKVLEYLDLSSANVTVAPPAFDPIADDISEQWVQRFREDCQKGWENTRW
ncbi:Stf0 family sulphotransferase [Paenibacillus illinoisensis]|uniref:Stf0 family sulfotransferase n=1 Tax=Paenibacillus illinoisensis TaxID=59845 RepID=UPI0034B68008